MSEMLIQAFVERTSEESIEEMLQFEPAMEFTVKSSLLLSPAAIDVARRFTVSLRIINPLEKTKTVYQDTVLGTAEVCYGVLRWGTPVAGENNIRKIYEISGGIDDQTEEDSFAHITDLYEKYLCTGKLSNEEAGIYKNLLCNYSDVFSKDEWDLGQTHLTEHEIITGEQRPIK